MTIRRGEEWGVPVDRPAELLVLGSDAQLAAHDGASPIAPGAGDLYETLGSPPLDRPVVQRVEVDGVRVVLDGAAERWAIAHVVARRSWWRGPVVAAMNVSQLGAWRVAPRAHPNDGLLDLIEAAPELPWRARWAARSRLPAGAHVPHPQITLRRAERASWTFGRPMRVWIDGVEIGRARQLDVEVVPDRYTVHF